MRKVFYHERERYREQSFVEVVNVSRYEEKVNSGLEAVKEATRNRKERAKKQIAERIKRRL